MSLFEETPQDPRSFPIPAYFHHSREIHIIISTLSGTHQAQRYFDTILSPYLASLTPALVASTNYSIHTTTSPTSITELTENLFLFNARRGVKQTLLLLSGDGGIADIVNALTKALMRDSDDDGQDSRLASIFMKPVVVLFPCGTANALGWSMRVAGSPVTRMMSGRAQSLPSFEVRFCAGAKLLTDEGRREIDLNSNEDGEAVEYAAAVVSWGLHASLVAMSDSAAYRRMGVERFRVVAEKLLKKTRRYKGHITFRKVREDGNGWEWLPLRYPEVSPGMSIDETGTTTIATAETDGNEHTSRKEPPTKSSSISAPVPASVHATESPAREQHTHSYILTTPLSNLEQNFVISPSASLSLPTTTTSHQQQVPNNLYLVALPAPLSSAKIMKVLGLAYKNGAHVQERDTVVYEEVQGLRVELLPPKYPSPALPLSSEGDFGARAGSKNNPESQNQNEDKAEKEDEAVKQGHIELPTKGGQQEDQEKEKEKEREREREAVEEEEWQAISKMHRMVCVDGRIIIVPEGGWFEVRRLERRSVVELVC